MQRVSLKIKQIIRNISLAIQSIFWKKDQSVVLFGAWFGERFADNSRFLYQYLHDNMDELNLSHVVWVTARESIVNELRSLGYEAYMIDSKESRYWHKRAKYHIICNSGYTKVLYDLKGNKHIIRGDILGELSYRAIRINLWHGTGGLKAVGMNSNAYKHNRDLHPLIYRVKDFLVFHSRFFQLFFSQAAAWGRCYQLSTAPIQTKTLYSSDGRQPSMCIETSYPRNCPCPKLLHREEEVIDAIRKHSSVILYLPTFRTNSKFQYVDLGVELKDVLKKNDILWIEKAHSAEMVNRTVSSNDDNRITLEPDFDINVLIPHITILLTDYSSVRMDAMFHNKATMFYVPDFDDYCNGDNGFLADPNEVMCGPKLYTVDELRRAIETYYSKPEASKTHNYPEIRDRYWSKNRSLSEIWDDILKVVG